MWLSAEDREPLPVTIVNGDASLLEVVLDMATALGTVLAVLVSVWVASRATRDRHREVKERKAAEAALAAEQKAHRQAIWLEVEPSWAGVLSGDLHGLIYVTVRNLSDREISEVTIELIEPLAVAPSGTKETTRRLLTEVITVVAPGASEVVSQMIYAGSHTPPSPPPCAVVFTDAFGDRWRRSPGGTLTLLRPRRIEAEAF